MRNRISLLIIVCICLVYAQVVGAAEQKQEASLEQLLNISLRELMDVKINLASRSGEKQFKSAAAVYVLTSEDIRRSGYRRIPEILRLIPGVNVAKQDANKWAVSIRNSQTRFSSTLLVMVDGRHVYTPYYAGVYWESVDTFIEDIDRIEVMRGPDGTLWGANAVDGIINIVTKQAADTQGSKAYGLVGVGEMKSEAGFRYGGETRNGANYRIYAKGYNTDSGEYMDPGESTNTDMALAGKNANDEGYSRQAGLRVDWESNRDTYSLQGSFYNARVEEDRFVTPARIPSEILSDGHNGSFKWVRKYSDSESLMFNTFYNQITRDNTVLFNDEATIEFDFQHNFRINKQDITWGMGYVLYKNKTSVNDISSCSFAMPCFSVDPASKDLTTWSTFIQDRINFSDKFAFIVGSKFEHNDYTGFEYQPTIRGLWTPDDSATYWAAATRAVRVPDRLNTDGALNQGGPIFPIGDKDLESFINFTYEAGARKNISSTWIVDGTLFYSDYNNTVDNFVTIPVEDVYGFEGYVKYQYNPKLKLELGYTYNEGDQKNGSSSNIPLIRLPQNTIKFRSYYDLKNDMDLDLFIYYVDESKGRIGEPTIPAYTRVDLRYGWRASNRFNFSLLLTNIFDDVHAEAIDPIKINTGVKRGAMMTLTYNLDN